MTLKLEFTTNEGDFIVTVRYVITAAANHNIIKGTYLVS